MKGKKFKFESSTFDENDLVNKAKHSYSKGNVEISYIGLDDAKNLKKQSSNFDNEDYIFLDKEEKFEDFLEMPIISGDSIGFSNANRISGDRIIDSNNYIALKDVNYGNAGSKDDFSTVILNKDADGNVIGVDVICKCGNKTRISFDFGETDGEELLVSDAEGVKIKDPGYDPSVIDEHLKHHIYETPGDCEDDDAYKESLLNDIDNKPES